MSYYQIIYIFPHPNDPVIFFVPTDKVSKALEEQMKLNIFSPPPDELAGISGLIYSTFENSYHIMPDIRITKIFTFII